MFIESVKNVSKLQARAMFLKTCQNLKITPTTLTIKPLSNSNPKLSAKYNNVAKTASKNNLQIAVLDSRIEATEAEMNHTNLLESLNLSEKTKNVPRKSNYINFKTTPQELQSKARPLK